MNALWRAVITQALDDALGTLAPLPGKYAPHHLKTRNREIRAARDWLLGNSKDYRLICSLADIDPSALRAKVLRIRDNGWKLLNNGAAAPSQSRSDT